MSTDPVVSPVQRKAAEVRAICYKNIPALEAGKASLFVQVVRNLSIKAKVTSRIGEPPTGAGGGTAPPP